MNSLLRTIRTFFKDPQPVTEMSMIVPGLNVVDGVVTVEEPLRSPVRGENCVAYFYRSFLVMTGGRNPHPAIHKLRQAEVYAPFTLSVEGGTLHVEPRRPGRFTREAHQALARQYGSGFQGVEEIIAPGARVRVRGRVQMINGQATMKMSLLTLINRQVTARGVLKDRKTRRQKRK